MLDYKFTTNKVSQTKVEFEVEVSKETFEAEKEKQYSKLSKKVQIKGFRPGKAPRDVIEQRLGLTLYDETIQSLLPKITVEILEKEEVIPVANIGYDLKEFDPEKELKYKATVYIYPEFEIPDFKKLNIKKEKVEVETKEVDEFLENFAKDVERRKNKDVKDFKVEQIDEKWIEALKIPEVKTLDELKDYLKKYLEQEKESANEQKYINDILEKAAEEAKIEVPEVLVENELEHRMSHDRERLEKLGIKWEDWMKQQGENIDKQKEDLRNSLEKTFKVQFLLGRISEKENIKVSEEELDAIINSSKDQKMIQNAGIDNVKRNLRDQLLNQRLVDWVVKQVEGEEKKK